MPRVRGFLRVVRRKWGHPDQGLPGEVDPTDPDYGIDEEGGDPGYGVDEGATPGHGLPGNKPPGHPGHLPAWPGFPPRPGHGLPVWPGRPVDPGFGVDEDVSGPGPGHLPAWPVRPERPDTGLPPVPGQPLPPVDPPPGTIWPPLPPGTGLKPGKTMILVWITGVGYRYVVLELKPGQGLPESGAPGQGLPGDPGREPKR